MRECSLRIIGRHLDATPPDWRDRLAARLGERPRRLGTWTELALYGALRCVDDAAESAMPADAVLRLCSRRATASPTHQALMQAQDGLPMPFTFLQSQTSQTLAALAGRLAWRGDAVFLASPHAEDAFALACQAAGPTGVLFGVLEEDPLLSHWVRLIPCEPAHADVVGDAAATAARWQTLLSA
ncbi:hypothetical protein ACDA63_08680 [Uliginosibacterium sp. sgz301328]|uniref:hypothetical protein n=1 Tax=Uliginosibacterium sp. sgz301328 TaxID=3243764 RepID=UPI00359D2808